MASTLQISSGMSAHRLASSHRLEPPRSVRCRNRTFPGLKITAFVSSLLAHRQCSLGALRQRNVALDCENFRGDKQLRYGQNPFGACPWDFQPEKNAKKRELFAQEQTQQGGKQVLLLNRPYIRGIVWDFRLSHFAPPVTRRAAEVRL